MLLQYIDSSHNLSYLERLKLSNFAYITAKNVLRINKKFLCKIILEFQQKVLMKVEDTYFEVKNSTASGPQTLGLQTNVSAN